MGTEQHPDGAVAALDTHDLDAKRKRRLARATEAFKKRAEASERRWLAGLSTGKPNL